MPAHPKPTPKAKKPGAMRKAPKKPTTGEKIIAGMKDVVEGNVVLHAPKPPKKVKAPSAAKPGADKGVSKTDLIMEMLGRPGGVTSKEIEDATGWQPHSVRGMLGTLRQRGIKVVSTKLPKEPTLYSVEAVAPAAPVGDIV